MHMRRKIVKILSVLITTLLMTCSYALGASSLFKWTPNTEQNLAGYKLYYGTVAGEYPHVKDVPVSLPPAVDGNMYTTVDGLMIGETYYSVITAYDTDNLESIPTDPISWVQAENITVGQIQNYSIVGKWKYDGDGNILVLDANNVTILTIITH